MEDMAVKVRDALIKYAVPVAFIAIFYVFVSFLGNNTLCFLRSTIGLPCPGCGLTRAFLSLFQGDFIRALVWHPLFLLPPFAFCVVLFKKNSIFNKIYVSKFFWIISVILLIGLWIIRMIFLFPSTAPMTYNSKAVLPTIIRFILQLFV